MPLPQIGMGVPGASSLYGSPSLREQVAGETEAERKRRLDKLRAAQQLPSGGTSSPAAGYGAALGGQ
jgi:hypothetical protein